MKRLVPLFDRVLVEKIKPPQKTAGGIVLPDTVQEKSNLAKVIAVGKGKRTSDGKIIPMTLKAGDTVLLGDYSGTEVKLNGKEYWLCKEDEVLGLVEEGEGSENKDIPNLKDLPKS